MKTKIIGTSSYEDVAIGESYIQECVISMWDNAPQNAFVYFSSNGCKMVLKKYTKTAERTYTSRVLAPSEITKDIRQQLVEKGNVLYINEELCPECGAYITEKMSGIKCSECDYWYCY